MPTQPFEKKKLLKWNYINHLDCFTHFPFFCWVRNNFLQWGCVLLKLFADTFLINLVGLGENASKMGGIHRSPWFQPILDMSTSQNEWSSFSYRVSCSGPVESELTASLKTQPQDLLLESFTPTGGTVDYMSTEAEGDSTLVVPGVYCLHL